MITVHHLNNSRSQRILWLLEELGEAYEIKHYQRHPKTMLGPKALYDVHPLGKSPVVTAKGEALAESGAIIECLIDWYGGESLRPPQGTPEYRAYIYWLHYAEASLMPLLLVKLIFDRLGAPPMPWLMRPIGKGIASAVDAQFTGPRIKEHLGFVEAHLQSNQWFAGEALSGADIQMSFPLEAATSRVDMSSYGGIQRFLEEIHGRDAYQRALERGGPYDYA